jgi:hypothetical protein
MSIQAFGTRRVTESLKAITKYLDDGALIAAGVSPAGVLSLNTELVPRPPSPRLTSVSPHVIKFDEGEAKDFTLTATGAELDGATVFRLVRGGSVIEASDLTINSPTSLTVDFDDVLDPIPGMYDAWVITSAGQAFVLDNACRIKVKANGSNASSSSAASSDPAQSAPGDGQFGAAGYVAKPGGTFDARVTVPPGTGDLKWYVKDNDGAVRENWKVEPVARETPKKKPTQQSRQPDVVGLSVTVPSGEEPGLYRVFAQSKTDAPGRLAFFVEVQ